MRSFFRSLRHLLAHIVFLCIVAILVSLEIVHEPETNQAVLIGAFALVFFSLSLNLYTWWNQPYSSSFANEKQASSVIKSYLDNNSGYQNLRICGTSCTSIFTLFHSYVQAMVDGKHLTVLLLNPDCEDIINYLRDCEPDREDVVSRVRQELEALRDEIEETSYNEISGLINDDPYGKNLISASIALWKKAHAVAHDVANPGLLNGLEMHLYTHLPTLKAWVFDDDAVFIGSYSPMPGGVGINNPIHLIRRKRYAGREIILDCRRTITFLANHANTERIELHL